MNPNERFYEHPETVEWLTGLGVFSGELAFLTPPFSVAGNLLADVGCGAGRLYRAAKDAGLEYFGCDPSAALVGRFLSDHPDANVVVASALALPWADGIMDNVVMTYHVIEAILGRSNRRRALVEVRRVLCQGGSLFMSYHLASKYRRRQQFVDFFSRDWASEFGDVEIVGRSAAGGKSLNGYRTHILSRSELRQLAKRCGFIEAALWRFDGGSDKAVVVQWRAI